MQCAWNLISFLKWFKIFKNCQQTNFAQVCSVLGTPSSTDWSQGHQLAHHVVKMLKVTNLYQNYPFKETLLISCHQMSFKFPVFTATHLTQVE